MDRTAGEKNKNKNKCSRMKNENKIAAEGKKRSAVRGVLSPNALAPRRRVFTVNAVDAVVWHGQVSGPPAKSTSARGFTSAIHQPRRRLFGSRSTGSAARWQTACVPRPAEGSSPPLASWIRRIAQSPSNGQRSFA